MKTISHKSTCFDLSLPDSLLCGVCHRKQEINQNLNKRGRIQKTNHRNIARRNRCEQRWSDEHMSSKNCSQSRLHTYYRTCDFIDIESNVAIEFGKHVCKSKRFMLETQEKPQPSNSSYPTPDSPDTSMLLGDDKADCANGVFNKKCNALNLLCEAIDGVDSAHVSSKSISKFDGAYQTNSNHFHQKNIKNKLNSISIMNNMDIDELCTEFIMFMRQKHGYSKVDQSKGMMLLKSMQCKY